jgi:acyl-CoA dehydrogenase
MVPNAEERKFLQYVREVAAEKIGPRAEQFDQTSEFPEPNMEVLNSLGLNGVFVPSAHGGIELSFGTLTSVGSLTPKSIGTNCTP